jgi:hypothetical protein
LAAERPKSAVGKACTYALGQWDGLLLYLDHGVVEIDNNSVYAARGINQIMPPPDLCRVAA